MSQFIELCTNQKTIGNSVDNNAHMMYHIIDKCKERWSLFMNEKKRYLTLTLAILLVIGTLLLAACNETQETGTTKETQTDAVTESQTETQTEAHQHTPVTDEEKPAT